jgi:ParB family transcriptional regulator, chromosome partitioning protein
LLIQHIKLIPEIGKFIHFKCLLNSIFTTWVLLQISSRSGGFFEEIKVNHIKLPQRTLRAELGNLDELTCSIQERGLLQPIIVRPLDNTSYFEVVAGNRRFQACSKLRYRKILCHIVDLDDKEAYEVSLIENVQHKTLELIEEAEAFNKYVSNFGYGGISELARKIGKSPSYVSRRISFLKLPREIQDQLLRQRKSASIAQELSTLDAQDKERLTNLIVDQNLTRDNVREIISKLNYKENDEEPLLSYYSTKMRRQHIMERMLTQCITSFKMCMMTIDEIIEHVEEEDWIFRELFMQYRQFTHQQIDSMLGVKKKIGEKYTRWT